MKTIGLIGGMSPESTTLYYSILNRVVNDTLGGLHSAQCILYSVDFQQIEECQTAGQWQTAADILAGAARALQAAGADFLVLCTNTMHKVAGEIEAAVHIPLLHIADITADALLAANIRTAALLGTKYTMEQDFYTARLAQRGIRVLVPDAAGRALVNDVIFKELCRGAIRHRSKAAFLSLIADLAAQGAQGVVLGCTEIGMLVTQKDTAVPLFDTTWLHAKAAAQAACAQEIRAQAATPGTAP